MEVKEIINNLLLGLLKSCNDDCYLPEQISVTPKCIEQTYKVDFETALEVYHKLRFKNYVSIDETKKRAQFTDRALEEAYCLRDIELQNKNSEERLKNLDKLLHIE